MKTRIVRSIILTTTGISIGLVIVAFGSTAIGQATKTPFLNLVFHDWTLIGNGTVDSPLGINAASPRSAGQVLTYNGTGLTWQRPESSDAAHFSQLEFNFSPNQPYTFTLPKQNVPVTVNISTSAVSATLDNVSYDVGPLVLTTVATMDSTASGGMLANGTCANGRLCEQVGIFSIVPGNIYAGQLHFVLGMYDRSTGRLTLSVRKSEDRIVVATPQIHAVVTMIY